MPLCSIVIFGFRFKMHTYPGSQRERERERDDMRKRKKERKKERKKKRKSSLFKKFAIHILHSRKSLQKAPKSEGAVQNIVRVVWKW